ncbi:uncharacterized protein LOC132197739 isoform X2 [Neocloeon triangulifer]|uniref:uncharacterized protein LOC132197739 isoform X2 n=1 Tax=Neocloeon triangulifer TaxID=2078957 RepID=UPI00286EC2CD|nr:uncharacterized protein LOC132197739 isoform X2 [Neocloeon triangulifer]
MASDCREIVVLVLALLHQCDSYPIDWTNTAGGAEEVWGPIAASLVLLVMCAALALLGCVCCRRNKSPPFQPKKGSENRPVVKKEFTDTTSNHSLSTAGFVNPLASAATPASASSEFTIFPPPGVQPPSDRPVPTVRFEPLPDIRPRFAVTPASPEHTPLRPAAFSSADPKLPFTELFDEPSFPRERLKYLRELGKGWFGKVVEGEGFMDGPGTTPVVVKILSEAAPEEDRSLFLREVAALRTLSHPNLLKVLGCSYDNEPLLITMEFCPVGDLKSFLINQRNNAAQFEQEGKLLSIMCQLAAGLEFMAQNGFVHTDLAARNCQLASDYSVKIGDYGNSIDRFKEEYYYAGEMALPIRWCAPETLVCTDSIIETKEVTTSANVWTFGVLLWEVIEFGSLPYATLSDEEVIVQVLGPSRRILPPPSLNLPHSQYLYHLMKLCWSSDLNRPNISQIKGMLHHLLSNKAQADKTFEERWATLKPNHSGLQQIPEQQEHIVVIEQHDLFASPSKDFPIAEKQRSPSLQNLHGSLDDVQELRSISLPNSREVSPVKTIATMISSTGDLFSSQSSTLDDDDTRKICEAIQDLDDALALEQTSSSECSSIVCTPIRRHSITAKPEDMTLRADSDSEEEETWRGRVERGEFSEKVRQKSQSVQDLMVLTHIDSSSDGDDTDYPIPKPLKYDIFKSEGNICGAVVIEGLLDSFRKLRKLSKIEDTAFDSLQYDSISAVAVDFQLDAPTSPPSNKFLSSDLSTKYLISEESAAISLADVQLEAFDQPYSILDFTEDTIAKEESSATDFEVHLDSQQCSEQNFDMPVTSFLATNEKQPKLIETEEKRPPELIEESVLEVPIVVTDLTPAESEVKLIAEENQCPSSPHLNLLQPPQKSHKSKPHHIELAAEPVSMIAYEATHPKHHRKIRDVSKDLNYLQITSHLQIVPSADTAGMIAFDSHVPHVSLNSPEDPSTELTEAAIVPVEAPTLPIMLKVERKPLPSPEKEKTDGPLSTIAFEYVADKQEALILDDVQTTLEPLFKPKRLAELCEETLVLDVKQYDESSMEAIILDVDTTTLAAEICLENPDLVPLTTQAEQSTALSRLDNLLNERIDVVNNWSTSADIKFPAAKRTAAEYEGLKTGLEEFSIKRTTPDDERSSDSGYRDKVSLSESCDGENGEKYNLEDIEVELETFGQLGTPSSDSGLERTPHDDLKGFDTGDSEDKNDDDDDFWKQQMASLKNAAGKTMALFHEAVGSDLSPSEEEKAYTNSWFKRSLEDSEGSSEDNYGMDEASEAAIRSELQQKLPNLGGCSDGGDEEEVRQEDIPVHYNIYPAPLSPILEEQESLASSGSCSPSVSVATKVAARSKSLSSSCSNSPAPVETPPLVLDRSEHFEADIRAAIESCSNGPQAGEEDDMLFVNTETNEATMVESPLKPKLPFLNFANGQQVYSGGASTPSSVEDQWVEDEYEEEAPEEHEKVTTFGRVEEGKEEPPEPMTWISLPSTKAPMPSPEEEHSKLVGAELNEPQRQCVTPDWESDTGSEDSCSSGEFVWKEGDKETEVKPVVSNEVELDEQNQAVEASNVQQAIHSPTKTFETFNAMDVIEEEDEDDRSSCSSSETEFIPSSWNSEATPNRSSLRSPERKSELKKNVSFKKEKYHHVYEYPREPSDTEVDDSVFADSRKRWETSQNAVDYATYADWELYDDDLAENADNDTDPDSSEHGKVQKPFNFYKLSSIECDFNNGVNSEEGDFFVSSSTRPFHLNPAAISTSQFFPGMSATDPSEPPSPGGSSGESSNTTPPSPLSPTSLGELRHTRDKLKLDLPNKFCLVPPLSPKLNASPSPTSEAAETQA